MSVVSSRVHSVSSILKSSGVREQLIKQSNRVHFKLPKDIKSILCNFEVGNKNQGYEEVIQLLQTAIIRDSDLLRFLAETRQCISSLSPKHKLFIETLLQLQWTDKSTDVVTVYKLFLEDLVCAQVYYTKAVIDHLVELFKPVEDNVEHNFGKFRNEDMQRLHHIHDVLHKILEIVPMSSKLLLQSLLSRFPYIIHSTYTHEVYIYALLQILDYAPQLRLEILSLILNRLMVLDVNIPHEDPDDDEDDLIDDSLDQITDVDNPTVENNDTDKMKTICPITHTLDVCMELFLKYMYDFCFENDILQIESLKVLYFDILQAFEKVILPTYASQYVQYIIFYMCSFKAVVVEAFIDRLWRKVTDPNVALVTRQSAVFYMSSLLATGSFINIGLVKLTIFKLVKWIHDYISKCECSEYHNNMSVHTLFYSICQAFFYLFAARYKEFVKSKNNILFLQELDIHRIVSCKLNPLKMCNAEIVHNFAEITNTYQLAYCYVIIENNARTQLSFGNETHSVLIPNFFPFKSYTLQYSGQRIIPLFYENVTGPDSRSSKRYE